MPYKDFEKNYLNTFDNLLEGFQLISKEWKYLYVNDAIVKQSKCNDKSDLLGKTMMECFPGIEKTDMFRILEKCMNERVSEVMENEFTFPDGSKGWFELRVEPVNEGIFILSMDISARKKSEELRKEHIDNLEELLFYTSHHLRQPITNISGLSGLLLSDSINKNELLKAADYMRESINNLEMFSRELTKKMNNLRLSPSYTRKEI
ncbi:MAG: PAS domain-containing protein [Bacteroidetes bacterium]|nr:PAS domain-containing protein [Bacteroidota bacterium]